MGSSENRLPQKSTAESSFSHIFPMKIAMNWGVNSFSPQGPLLDANSEAARPSMQPDAPMPMDEGSEPASR